MRYRRNAERAGGDDGGVKAVHGKRKLLFIAPELVFASGPRQKLAFTVDR